MLVLLLFGRLLLPALQNSSCMFGSSLGSKPWAAACVCVCVCECAAAVWPVRATSFVECIT